MKESQLAKEQWMDLLLDKMIKGVHLSFKKFLKEAVEQNKELVIMRHNKVVLVPAREIKIKK
ncbi:MAG: hypothetical protein KA149_13410 [Chitinophagales bacterium]|nr:hypothetical protein [Chitinophagales bacterium]